MANREEHPNQPNGTSTASDYMKPWIIYIGSLDSDDESTLSDNMKNIGGDNPEKKQIEWRKTCARPRTTQRSGMTTF